MIRSLNLEVRTLSQYRRALNERSFDPNRTVILTFDDGDETVERVAMPIMNEFGYVGTTQVVADWIQHTTHTLNEDQLRRLYQAGWDVGGHGFSHVMLPELRDEELAFELSESRKILERALDRPVDMMSVPRGPYDRRVRTAAEKAGYQSVFCSVPGINRANTDPLSLRRMIVQQRTDLDTFERILTRDPSYYIGERIRRSAFLSLQRLLGARRYGAIRAKLLGVEEDPDLKLNASARKPSTATQSASRC
jgi:peptidoglycan/xylan/chitin deacetylase (PgdA/CDA1 family)